MFQFIKKYRWCSLCFVLALALSCGRTNTVIPEVVIRGKVQAGPVSGAQVEIYELTEEAQIGKFITSTQTDSEGLFFVQVRNLRPKTYLIAKATGGVYLDEASQIKLNLNDNDTFQSIIPVDQLDLKLPITPLSHMVAEGVLKNRKASRTLADCFAAFSSALEVSTGLHPGDLKHLPQSPQFSTQGDTPEERLDAVLTGLSSVLESLQVPHKKKNLAYAEIAKYFANEAVISLSPSFSTRISSTSPLALTSLLAEHFSSKGLKLSPVVFGSLSLTFLSTFCGPEDGPLGPGQLCCNPAGCENACIYETPKQGQSCEDLDQHKPGEEKCRDIIVRANQCQPTISISDFEEAVLMCQRNLGPYTAYTNCTNYQGEMFCVCAAKGIEVKALSLLYNCKPWGVRPVEGPEIATGGHALNILRQSDGKWCVVDATAGDEINGGTVYEPCFDDPNSIPNEVLEKVVGPFIPENWDKYSCRFTTSVADAPSKPNTDPQICAENPAQWDSSHEPTCRGCCIENMEWLTDNQINEREKWFGECMQACGTP